MIKRNWELFQSWTMEDSNRISALFNEFNDNERFPALLNFIMGFNYDKKGLYKEAEDVFLKIYEDDVNGAQYWKIINEYRIMNFKNIQKPRPKILSNIYGGRMGLAMIANADVITFIESKKLGYFKTDIIYYNPFENNFSDILEILPEGWKPDYVFIAISEAEPFPTGIELSPYPVVGLPGDPGWRMNKEYHDVKFFDLVVPAMAHYVKPYTLMGANKAIYTSCAGLQGSTSLMYNDKIEKQKQWDVIFTGATSSPLYRNRSHYLWRLLKLADRYKIFIGFFDNEEDAFHALAGSKISIHCTSIQGGMNLRPFEIAASGALLLHEEGDGAVKEFFTPGEEIVLFNKENFEDVIEYYLKNDNERERIAANGRKKNFEKLTARLNMKNVISKINEIKIDINKRPAKFLSEHEKLNSLGISNFYGNKYHKAAFLFSQALQIVNKDKKYLNNLSVTLMVLKALNNEDHPEVKNFLETVCKANEHAIIPRFNLLSYYKCIESDRNIFFALGADLIDDLRQKKYKDDLYTGDELFFFLETEFNKLPNSLIFRTEIEFLLYHYPNRGQEYQEKFYNTILWRIFEYVGDFYSDDGLYEESINCYQMVLQYCSMNEYVLEKISKAYIKLQQFENAEISLKNLLNLSPLHEEANYLLSEVEMKLNKKQEMKARLTRLMYLNSLKNREKLQNFLKL